MRIPLDENVFLSAVDAARFLDVKLSTLYSYASRGLVQAVCIDGGRQRFYMRADLERLRQRALARSGHGPVAAAALNFGEPILASEITSIHDNGPHYRCRPALDFAERDDSFEAVADWLWSTDHAPSLWRLDHLAIDIKALRSIISPMTGPLVVLSLVVLSLAAQRLPHEAMMAERECDLVRPLLRHLIAGLALRYAPAQLDATLAESGIAAMLIRSLGGVPDHRSTRALNGAMVLLADHELANSTFTARVSASAGADVYACFGSALAALSGLRHGGSCDRIEAMLLGYRREIGSTLQPRFQCGGGERIPGFFRHPLYPNGDPRAHWMLRAAAELAPAHPSVRHIMELARLSEDPPGADLGMVALATALGWPNGTAICIWAIARCAGWMAHIQEQRLASFIRPRALPLR